MLVRWGISESLVAGRWYVSKRRKATRSTRENAYTYKVTHEFEYQLVLHKWTSLLSPGHPPPLVRRCAPLTPVSTIGVSWQLSILPVTPVAKAQSSLYQQS